MEKTPPSEIYLLPVMEDSEEHGWIDYVWCDDPAPEDDMDPKDAVQYIRADDRAALQRALDRLKVK